MRGGHEAALIGRLQEAEVHTVDVTDQLNEEFRNWPELRFQVGTVFELLFADNSIHGVSYHHVIECVDDPAASLAELSRVLKPGGWIFIGTPNRHRLVSSVGAHQQTSWEPTWRNKLNDNLNDWSGRLRGKFRNEFGAHAGFSRGELSKLLTKDFERQIWVTKPYLQYKYLNHRFAPAVSLFASRPWQNIGVPSIYVFACKPTEPSI